MQYISSFSYHRQTLSKKKKKGKNKNKSYQRLNLVMGNHHKICSTKSKSITSDCITRTQKHHPAAQLELYNPITTYPKSIIFHSSFSVYLPFNFLLNCQISIPSTRKPNKSIFLKLSYWSPLPPSNPRMI